MSNKIIIPARLLSTRLPNKLLLKETGYPLLWHTIQRATESKKADTIIVATEDKEIEQSVYEYNKYTNRNIIIKMTGICNSGTDRIAIVAQNLDLKDDDIIINLQGDEPELEGQYIDELINIFPQKHWKEDQFFIATLAALASSEETLSPDVVKVVRDHQNNAMYFSRSPIPYTKDHQEITLKHIGIYAFRYCFLRCLNTLAPTTLISERLEQLQWLQSGFKINVLVRDISTAGIDTVDEYKQFVGRCKEQILKI